MLARQTPSIAIVGAGIGGLAAAAALRKVGFDVTVYEQAEAFARVGAGIQQSPNAIKVHRGLGIEDRLRQVAFAPASALDREAATGKVTSDRPLGKAVEERYGAPYLVLHRGDLHAALAASVPASCVIRGKTLVRLETRGPRVELRFADGAEIEADVVIGADGVHSLVHAFVAGPAAPRFTGRLTYRAGFPASLLCGLRIGTSRTRWWGKDRHIVVSYVTRARDQVYFSTSLPEPGDRTARESWSSMGDRAEMRAAFRDFHSDVQGVLAAAPEVHKWGIYERDPLATWSRGRVVLLGDACHPMTPDAACGAAMALEDAVVLARCFGDADCESPEAAFRIYEATRKPRTSVVQAGSSAAPGMRNDTSPDWLYGYDAWRVPLRSLATAKYEATNWEA
jgi:salicylate hydroxylase/6-hydroxynicotinate 3-monooxygenase